MRPALFLHIQKTAGTSVQQLARHYYGNVNVASHGDFLTIEADDAGSRAFLSGHFGIAYARSHLAARYSFTFLRSPIERLLSLYRYCHAQPAEAHYLYKAARAPLASFLEQTTDPDIQPFLQDNMVWQLAHGWCRQRQSEQDVCFNSIAPQHMLALAQGTLATLDYVGFHETFDSDIRAIFADLGASDFDVPRVNVTADTTQIDYIDPEILARMHSLTRLDKQLYDYAWQKFGRASQLNDQSQN